MKRLAERGSMRPPRRGYLAPCAVCGLEVLHYRTTGEPAAQHRSSKAHLEAVGRVAEPAAADVHIELHQVVDLGELVLAFFLVLLVAGCALGDVESMRPQHTPRACYASFEAALEGYELFMGPLPAECLHLDEVYTIELTSGPMPCTSSDPGRVIGCAEYGPHRITLRAGLGEEKTVNIAVHEWMHALSACAGVSADDNAHHADPRIWGEDPHDMSIDLIDPQSARAYALGSSGVGPCLD